VNHKKIYLIAEVAERCHLSEHDLYAYIEKRWLKPMKEDPLELDEEDLARTLLILELQRDMGVNDEAIPIILHLLDQLNFFHHEFVVKFSKE